ncbi:MAG: class I SAM-dependent methyltransferase [Desulfobacterales bacterium]|nr:class I SAM-dependent methyltransferase [Desulfobacterales bacterium]
MASVKDHYEGVLSDVYPWMCGGIENGIRRNLQFFRDYQFTPKGSGKAVDLGAGCGFQSIPLARAGYSVTAIDLDAGLLDELKMHSKGLDVTPIQSDLMLFEQFVQSDAELVVCMTDTILHLESKEMVVSLFEKVFAALEDRGRFVITFRDLTVELTDVERFLPVKSDENLIFTCFLEYEAETVKVHDLIYKKVDGEWCLRKGFYRKLRLSKEWIIRQLSACGFTKIESTVDQGLITIMGSKEITRPPV